MTLKCYNFRYNCYTAQSIHRTKNTRLGSCIFMAATVLCSKCTSILCVPVHAKFKITIKIKSEHKIKKYNYLTDIETKWLIVMRRIGKLRKNIHWPTSIQFIF